MSKMRMTQYIGEVTMVIEPDAYTSAAIAASDNDSGVSIAGMDGVLFILTVGDAAALTSLDVVINYSSTGNASDAGVSSDNWASTNALFATVDSDGVNEVYLLDLNIRSKGMSDVAGALFASVAAPSDAVDFGLVAIPYGGTRTVPSTNENTIVVAD